MTHPQEDLQKALKLAVEALEAFQRGDARIQVIVADALTEIRKLGGGV